MSRVREKRELVNRNVPTIESQNPSRHRAGSFAIAAIVFCFVLAISDVTYACPNCKGSVSTSGSGMAAGFAYSVGLMLLIPLTILSAWTVALRRLFRSAAFRR